jgi:hypothetical protein
MADVSDIESTLVTTVTQAIYPNGTAQASIANVDCRIFRGWPTPDQLDTDLAAGKVNVSIFPQPVEQRTTRYPRSWQPLALTTPALTVAVSNTTITFGGTPSSPLNAAALVNGKGYVYSVQTGDTLTMIATGLAALVNADTSATSSGSVITIPGAKQLAARVGGFGTVIRETKRQKRNFQISFWCPTPTLRDALVPPVDQVLADIDFLTLPDGSAGRLLYVSSPPTDRVEREGLYRRDLIYSVEYGTTDTASAATVALQLFNLSGGLDPSYPPIATVNL